ncbi:Shedu immune nuclease family protein [Pseudomonas aeruginosa]|uniref:Shedu immune nuclease family protein n=1 Tax=Pseudomonas aeruginosa TaxID=287 RepID=UPI003D27A7D1
MAGTEGQDDVELDVWDPELRLDRGKADDGEEYRDLYMQTFVRDSTEPHQWRSQPESRWHHLARVHPKKVVTYPVFSNPYAQRYLSCRHGRFKTIAYELDVEHPLPGNVDEAKSHIETVSAFDLFNPCAFGLGLIKDLDEVWRGLAGFANLNAIVLTQSGGLQIDGDTVRIPVVHIESMRRAFNRTNRKVREVVRLGKRTHVRNVLLSRLDPERYPRVMQVNQEGQLIEVRLDHSRTSKNAARSQRRATVDAVRTNVDTLAAEAPQELIRLHAEIERATLAQMIEKYEEMLKKKLPEAEWQSFFERNIFILTMVFARPVRLLHTQFHAKPGRVDGKGAQIGDFLFAEHGFAMAIVEIKKPASLLLRAKPYRNTEVFAPSADLAGAVTQVLYQKNNIHQYWLYHKESPELKDSRPDAVKCVVITGMLPKDELQRRSFEVFRNSSKDVEIITFDELLAKLRLLSEHLASPETDNSEPPF